MGLSDTMLAGGCGLHIEAIHGELVLVVTGRDAGKRFSAVRENASDVVLDENMGADVRAKRMIRFRDGSVPQMNSQDILETMDGKRWRTVKAPQDGYLTTDFELIEIVSGKDK